MNIEGLSEAILEKLWKESLLSDFASIYQLNQYEQEIVSLKGFGQQAFSKMWAAIEKSRQTTLNRVISAVGIPTIGRTAGKAISDYFQGDEKAFMNAVLNHFDFTVLPDFGQTMQDNLISWFENLINLASWNNLMQELIINKPTKTVATAKGKLSGLTIVPTGTLRNFTRSGIKAAIENNGGKCGSSVSKKTDYVLVGEKPGSKLDKGKALGIPLITESDFLAMI